MSLFDDVLDQGSFAEKPYGPHEAVAGVLLAASACDGHIAEEEVNNLVLVLRRMKLYSRVNDRAFGNMMDRLLGHLKKGGPEKLLKLAVPAIPDELRETVFINACDIILADGTVEPDERQFVDDLMQKLDVEQARAKTFVQVMVYKNKT